MKMVVESKDVRKPVRDDQNKNVDTLEEMVDGPKKTAALKAAKEAKETKKKNPKKVK